MDLCDFELRDSSKPDCAENSGNTPGQHAYGIFSIERRFRRSKFRFFQRSRKPAHESIKERYFRKSRYFTTVGQSFVKTFADRHGHAEYHNKHC